MTQSEYMLIIRAIENCEAIERTTCESYAILNPEHRERIEHNRDMFLFATMMVRMEIDRMIKGHVRRTA